MSKEAEEYLKENNVKSNPRSISFWKYWMQKYAEYYHQAELKKIMPSDEDMESYIDKYIEENGYKMHSLSQYNECVTETGVMSCMEWLKQKLLKQ